MREHPDAVFPVTREILEASKGWDAAATFKAQYQLREFARQAEDVWQDIDVLLLPTTPRLYTVEENLADPFATNTVLGRYTNFMNLLDLSAVAVPAGRARAGRAAVGCHDGGSGRVGPGLAGAGGDASTASSLVIPPAVKRIPIAVCGAHLEGLALHWQLADRGGTLREKTTTAAGLSACSPCLPAGPSRRDRR